MKEHSYPVGSAGDVLANLAVGDWLLYTEDPVRLDCSYVKVVSVKNTDTTFHFEYIDIGSGPDVKPSVCTIPHTNIDIYGDVLDLTIDTVDAEHVLAAVKRMLHNIDPTLTITGA